MMASLEGYGSGFDARKKDKSQDDRCFYIDPSMGRVIALPLDRRFRNGNWITT